MVSLRPAPDGWAGLIHVGDGSENPDGGEIRTHDDGRHWAYSACATASACVPTLAAAGLQIRGDQVSTDRGTTWRRVRITPTPARDLEAVTFSSVARVGTGWLATAFAAPPSDRSYGFLLHSANGRDWTSQLTDPCPAHSNGRPNSNYSEPVRLNGRWWTLYACRDLINPAIARVLVGDGSGMHWHIAVDVHRRAVSGLVPINGRMLTRLYDPDRFDRTITRVLVIDP